jgi:lipopolysaccharide transport system permease protein
MDNQQKSDLSAIRADKTSQEIELQKAFEKIQLLEQQLNLKIASKPVSKPGPLLEPFTQLWQYRHFISSWVYRDLISRAVRSQHGLFWMIFSPLAMTGIYILAFSSIIGGTIRGSTDPLIYPFFMTIGIAAWNLFSDLVLRLMATFTANAGLIKKLAFPRICLPVSIVLSAWVTKIITMTIIVMLFALFGKVPSEHILWFPFLLFSLSSLAIGIGMILAVFTVFFRDLSHAIPIVLQSFFWITPIVYPLDSLKSPLKDIVQFNPLVPIVESYRDIFVFHKNPDFIGLLYVFLVGLVFQAVAFYLFSKAQKEIVDVL